MEWERGNGQKTGSDYNTRCLSFLRSIGKSILRDRCSSYTKFRRTRGLRVGTQFPSQASTHDSCFTNVPPIEILSQARSFSSDQKLLSVITGSAKDRLREVHRLTRPTTITEQRMRTKVAALIVITGLVLTRWRHFRKLVDEARFSSTSISPVGSLCSAAVSSLAWTFQQLMACRSYAE
jgi:hypothetical protein